MLGLAALYQSVRTAALKQQQQPQLLSAFTTELYAYNLQIKYLSVAGSHQFMQMSLGGDFKRYVKCFINTPQLFIGDVLLLRQLRWQTAVQHRPLFPNSEHFLRNTDKNSSSYLVELLQKSAVEHLTTYCQFKAQDFSSVATIVTTDFEALYAYKRGDYQRCLNCLNRPYRHCCMLVACPHSRCFRSSFS